METSKKSTKKVVKAKAAPVAEAAPVTPASAPIAPKKVFPPKKDPIAYTFTLFTLEGHETWRGHLGNDAGAFDRVVANERKQGHAYKITGKKIFIIDRVNGMISEQK